MGDLSRLRGGGEYDIRSSNVKEDIVLKVKFCCSVLYFQHFFRIQAEGSIKKAKVNTIES